MAISLMFRLCGWSCSPEGFDAHPPHAFGMNPSAGLVSVWSCDAFACLRPAICMHDWYAWICLCVRLDPWTTQLILAVVGRGAPQAPNNRSDCDNRTRDGKWAPLVVQIAAGEPQQKQRSVQSTPLDTLAHLLVAPERVAKIYKQNQPIYFTFHFSFWPIFFFL